MKPGTEQLTPRLLMLAVGLQRYARLRHCCHEVRSARMRPRCCVTVISAAFVISPAASATTCCSSALQLARRAHGHRDPHRRAIGTIHPGMVGDGEREV